MKVSNSSSLSSASYLRDANQWGVLLSSSTDSYKPHASDHIPHLPGWLVVPSKQNQAPGHPRQEAPNHIWLLLLPIVHKWLVWVLFYSVSKICYNHTFFSLVTVALVQKCVLVNRDTAASLINLASAVSLPFHLTQLSACFGEVCLLSYLQTSPWFLLPREQRSGILLGIQNFVSTDWSQLTFSDITVILCIFYVHFLLCYDLLYAPHSLHLFL